MNERPTFLTDAELETALFDLARVLAPTPSPDLAAMVRVRVAGLGTPVSGRLSWLDGFDRSWGRPTRRAVVLGLAVLLALAGVAAAIGFGLPGLRIVILGPGVSVSPTIGVSPTPGASPGSSPPSVSPQPTAAAIETLGLGEPVDPKDVDLAAGYHVLLPTLLELGRPLGVFVRGSAPTALVGAAYAATPTIPAGSLAPIAAGQPVAILVMEFPGASDADYLQKMLPPGTSIEPVTVGGKAGFWIAGQPHELLYLALNGDVLDEPARLAANVLAWNDGDRTIRIEGAPDLATAMRIAASLR